MAKRKGLGRGLEALLPNMEETVEQIENTAISTSQETIYEIPVGSIDRNPDQPRQNFDQESLEALASSIRVNGVISPILLVKNGRRYTIIAGERRWRASQIAGLKTVPAIVRDWDEMKRQEAALIENIQRQDLNPIEEAEGIRRLMDEYQLTQEVISDRLGKSRPVVANLLRLLHLPEEIQNAVKNGVLSAGHARVLAGIDDPEKQKFLFEKTLSMHLSVRQLEDAAKAEKKPPKSKTATELPVEYHDLADRLRQSTGLRVHFSGSQNKGKIILEYASEQELERLWNLLEEQNQ